MKNNNPTQEDIQASLNDISSQLRQTNRKLDHVIMQLSDDYYRRFYELYGRHLEG